MKKARNILDKLMDVVEIWIPSAMMLALFLAFLIQIASRYLFNRPLVWPYELSQLAYLWVITLGCNYAQRTDENIVFSVVYDLVPVTVQKIFDLISSLLVSGSFIGSDMQREDERRFTREVMHYDFAGSARADSTGIVRGLNLNLPLQRDKGGDTYAVIAPDALMPVGNGAFTAFAYGQGQSAGIAYSGKDCRVVAMGFPFEGIADADLRRQAIRALVDFLTK